MADVRTDVVEARCLDEPSDTLKWDDNAPTYAFRFPDAYGDDLRNQRFRAPASCVLIAAMFAFPTRGGNALSTGDPDLVVKVWPMGEDSLPVAGAEWVSDTTFFESYASALFDLDSVWSGAASQFVIVDLSSYSLASDSGAWFHVGYTAVRDSEDDSLAILSDDGSPQTSYASEWYNGRFVLMRDGWLGANFLIRAVVDLGAAGVRVLEPASVSADFALRSVYPNPFNAVCVVSFDCVRSSEVRLSVFDLLGRERAELARGIAVAGTHRIVLDASDWSSGTYFVWLQAGQRAETVRIVLEK